jgi:NAD(P)H-hydrate epimerase
MNDIDRRTIDAGIPGLILMENAAHHVVDVLVKKFSPLHKRRVVAVCGRGNNGGDGLAVARQLWTRFRPKSLHVILTSAPGDLNRDAAANFKMLQASGCPNVYAGPLSEIPQDARFADVVIDAVLGTGVNGAAQGTPLEGIRLINTQFPFAKVVAIDIPSGLSSNMGDTLGEFVRADHTVTFTAYKVSQILPPSCDLMGELHLGAIGTPPEMFESDPGMQLALITPQFIAPLFGPRPPESNKGTYGHVLVIAGSRGKTGAAVMSGISALRVGAGLVTVASAASAVPGIASRGGTSPADVSGHILSEIVRAFTDLSSPYGGSGNVTVATPASAIPVISSCAPELMTESLAETATGAVSNKAFDQILRLAESRDVVAVGPGLGTDPETVELVRRLYRELPKTLVLDADGLNALAGGDWIGSGHLRILTPHPGEMARLTGKSIKEIQSDRVGTARAFAAAVDVQVVLKGHRTVVASPDGMVLVNRTGSPAMATAGTGDVLTGLTAGMVAQFSDTREQARDAVAAAVYLHGLAGEIGGRALGEKPFVATDLLRYLPEAMRQIQAAL